MEDLAPVLAPTLGRLARSPGASPNWIAPVLRRLERDLPETYDRFRRLYGLSRKIASLASLSPQDTALLAPAALFAALLDIAAPPPAGSGAWLRYLREQSWAHYALQAARTAHEVAGSAADSRVAAALTAATVIDNEAVIRSANILRALRELRALASTPEMSRVAELLWTERGQSICDLHARHGGRTYVIDPDEFTAAIRLLQDQRRSTERPDSPRGASAPTEPPARAPRRAEVRTTAPPASATSEAFERRKRAVAETHSLREAFGLTPPGHREEAHVATAPARQPPETASAPPDGSQASDTVRQREPQAPPAADPAPTPIIEERPMNETTRNAASPAELDARLTASVEELRQRLSEIERLAAEGQQTLARLAPTIEGFAAMVAEFESVLSRWRGGRSEAA